MRVLLHGLGITGVSTVRALQRHGDDVTVTDDVITAAKREIADQLGVELQALPDAGLDDLVRSVDVVMPAPAVPEHHRLFTTAAVAGVPVWSEIELAYRWEQQRPGGPRPLLAITGTDGKTTTTDLTVALLAAAGHRAVALGNTATPMLEAIGGSADDVDVLVVECTSFRLAGTEQFRADAAVWLNLAPDHLNWHHSFDSYRAAKTRIFSQQSPSDVAIGFVDDPIVSAELATAPGRQLTFGRHDASYFSRDGHLVGPAGPIAPIERMWRALPHDITNALAASALVIETGLVAPQHIADGLATFVSPAHRLERVGASDGVTWYNDSKATTPHAAGIAVRGFDSLVLIAGGSDKGVDLGSMATASSHVRAVVAIGETAPKIRAAFAGHTVIDASSMAEAVTLASAHARPGDAVVLSPGCASFDWFDSYEHRGDVFRGLVHDMIAARTAAATGPSTGPPAAPHHGDHL